MTKYHSALILGYGRSGRAAEQLLLKEGTQVVVVTSDDYSDTSLEALLNERAFGVAVVSPGFALNHPWVEQVVQKQIPLLSELELGWSRHRGKTLSLTGSNGKSTAVKWIQEALVEAGLTAEIGGNYGIPACEVVLASPELEWLVLEVSSFQLETIQNFRSDVAVFLNLLPNHLDRHESMETYRGLKARIFGGADAPSGCCIAPVELLAQLKNDVDGPRNWMGFGAGSDFVYKDGVVYEKTEPYLDLVGTSFESAVIGSCTGAAVAAVSAALQIAPVCFEAVARRFEALPHRLQKLGEICGVSYINDSKATNLAAMVAALQACGNRVHLIAGGLPKESDYTFVKEILAERTLSIYLLGQASRAMFQAWNESSNCIESGTLGSAFEQATHAAKEGDCILLSPACASFDQFASFEERGRCFERLFQDLKVRVVK